MKRVTFLWETEICLTEKYPSTFSQVLLFQKTWWKQESIRLQGDTVEVESIGGICIPVLGNLEVRICLFQKAGIQVDPMVMGI